MRLAAALVVGVLLAPAGAANATGSALHATAISAPDPFGTGHCGFSYADSFLLGNQNAAPFEPEIAVNPADPRNMVAAYIQDDFLSDVVAVTHDGGRSWKTRVVPKLSKCSGGGNSVAADPSVVFSSDGGTVYLAALVANDPSQPVLLPHAPSGVVVARSRDRGRSWSAPVVVKDYDGQTGDMNRLAADPGAPKRAYLTWPDVTAGTESTGRVEFARTADAGAHWSTPKTIFTAGQNEDPTANRVLAFGKGVLTNVFVDFHPSNLTPGPVQTREKSPILAIRSTDDGASWSSPVKLGDCCTGASSAPSGTFLTDYPSVASRRGGDIYVAWPRIDASGPTQILLSHSSDRGRHWSRPRAVVSAKTEAAVPTLALARSGALVLTYYEIRSSHAPAQKVSADFWAKSSTDGGASWKRTLIAGPLDLASDPRGGIQDYEGLAAIAGRSVAAAFELPKPFAVHGQTDIFFSRIRTGSTPRVHPAHPGKLHLTVDPKTAHVGHRTRFAFVVTARTATSRRREPVVGATIRFVGRRRHTNRRGVATVSVKFRKRGRHRAKATKPGYPGARALVRVDCRDPDHDGDCDRRGDN